MTVASSVERDERAAAREFHARRREEALNAQITTRCARCTDWSYTGSARDALVAAREHRRSAHPDLPEKTPNPRERHRTEKQVARQAKEERELNERRERILAVLREAEYPLTSTELSDRTDISAPRIAALLGRWGDGEAVMVGDPRRWWLRERGEPPEVESEPKPKRRPAEPPQARRAVLAAVDRLRQDGHTTATAAQIAQEAGLGSVSTAKVLGWAGYERVAESTWNLTPRSAGS